MKSGRVAATGSTLLSPVRATLASGLLFLLVEAFTAPHRHFYDDETINAFLVRHETIVHLYRFAQSTDVHPPLGYIFNGLIFAVFHRLSAVIAVSALLSAATASLLTYFGSARTSIAWVRLLLALSLGLNPSLHIWCVSLRWYAYWVPLSALLFSIVFFIPRRKWTLPVAGFLSVLAFYISYLTPLLVLAICLAEWARGTLKFSRRLAATGLIAFLCILPQLYYFVKVHLPNSKDQSSHSPLSLFASGGVGTFLGPSVFPLSPYALLFVAATLIVIAGIIVSRRGKSGNSLLREPLFTTALFLTAIELVLGVAVKERNLTLVNLLLTTWICLNLPTAGRYIKIFYLGVLAVFLAISTKNLILRTNTGKASVNMPIEALYKAMSQDRDRFGLRNKDVWLFTWSDTVSGAAESWHVEFVGPFARGPEHEDDSFSAVIPKGSMVVLLKTQRQGWKGPAWESAQAISKEVNAALTNRRDLKIGYDPYYKLESKMTKFGEFPEFPIVYSAGITDRDLPINWVGRNPLPVVNP